MPIGERSEDVHKHGGTEGPLEHLKELWGPEVRTHRARRPHWPERGGPWRAAVLLPQIVQAHALWSQEPLG